MAKIWAAYTHTVHYLVDTEDEIIEEVELPEWINSFQNPSLLWDNTSMQSLSSISDEEYEHIINILETEPLPDTLS